MLTVFAAVAGPKGPRIPNVVDYWTVSCALCSAPAAIGGVEGEAAPANVAEFRGAASTDGIGIKGRCRLRCFGCLLARSGASSDSACGDAFRRALLLDGNVPPLAWMDETHTGVASKTANGEGFL